VAGGDADGNWRRGRHWPPGTVLLSFSGVRGEVNSCAHHEAPRSLREQFGLQLLILGNLLRGEIGGRAPEDEVCGAHLFFAKPLGLCADDFAWFFPAGGIDEFNRNVVKQNPCGKIISRGSGNWRHDRLIASGESVEEGAFAGIWKTCQNNAAVIPGEDFAG
jgi:hypothetical protein